MHLGKGIVLIYSMKHIPCYAPSLPFNIQDLSTWMAVAQTDDYGATGESLLIIWVQEGSGFFSIDLLQYPVAGGTIFCIYPQQLYGFDACHFQKGYTLAFTPEFLFPLKNGSDLLLESGLFNRNRLQPLRIGATDTKAELEQLMTSMAREFIAVSDLATEIIRALLKIFLMHLIRNAGIAHCNAPAARNQDADLVNQFLKMVQTDYISMKKVADYAHKLNISPNYLNIKVKRVTGFTSSYHIQQRVVLEAKRQARWAGLSLKEIAYKLGYDDLSHFSKFFKKSAGINFSHFKRSGPETIG